MQTDIHKPEPQVSTLSGELSLLNPDPKSMRRDDIITALRHQCRYGGHTTEPVSILQHSINVWLLALADGASFDDQREALWHDAPEAYILDVPRPLKRLLGDTYAQIEHRFEVAVGTALGVDLTNPPADLRKWDTEALASECYLWRPKTAYADWAGLPEVSQDRLRLARIAQQMAGWPFTTVCELDDVLRTGNVKMLNEFLNYEGYIDLARATLA
jgi:hypothetical protein